MQAKEVQEELAMDMKILQDLLAQTDNDKHKQAMRKKELNEEMQCYRSYLEEQKREEEKREKELDTMVQAEVGLTYRACICSDVVEAHATAANCLSRYVFEHFS